MTTKLQTVKVKITTNKEQMLSCPDQHPYRLIFWERVKGMEIEVYPNPRLNDDPRHYKCKELIWQMPDETCFKLRPDLEEIIKRYRALGYTKLNDLCRHDLDID